MRPWKVRCEVFDAILVGTGEPKGDGCGAAAALPKGVGCDGAAEDPNSDGCDAAGVPPNGEGEPIPEEPNGLLVAELLPNAEAEPKPRGAVVPNGEGAGDGAVIGFGAPNGDGEGAFALVVVNDDATVCIEPLPEENGEGAGALLLPNVDVIAEGPDDDAIDSSRGLRTLYFAASLLNISTSRP